MKKTPVETELPEDAWDTFFEVMAAVLNGPGTRQEKAARVQDEARQRDQEGTLEEFIGWFHAPPPETPVKRYEVEWGSGHNHTSFVVTGIESALRKRLALAEKFGISEHIVKVWEFQPDGSRILFLGRKK